MSYVGKILVVVQVVLSLLFMALAGGVYAINANWRAKHKAVDDQLTETQRNLQDAQEEHRVARQQFEQRLAAQTASANDFQAQNVRLQGLVATLQQENNRLELQRESQTGLAEAKSNEARFRQEEAQKQRIENAKLQGRLDETAAELRNTKDQLFTRDEEYRGLNDRYERNLKQLAYLERIVASHKLETDPEVAGRLEAPPPPVTGLILEVRKNRTGRAHLVELSIGSDDGLVKGHELDVVRVIGVESPQWLGVVKVVDLDPDSAVAEVILPSKNGIIQEGDNVTTKL